MVWESLKAVHVYVTWEVDTIWGWMNWRVTLAPRLDQLWQWLPSHSCLWLADSEVCQDSELQGESRKFIEYYCIFIMLIIDQIDVKLLVLSHVSTIEWYQNWHRTDMSSLVLDSYIYTTTPNIHLHLYRRIDKLIPQRVCCSSCKPFDICSNVS